MADIPQAGSGLDLLVALRVFGKDRSAFYGDRRDLPRYSTDMADAWKVVERLRDLHKSWCSKWAECFPAALKQFEEMSDERKTAYGNDPEELADEMTGTRPFDFDVFFNRVHRAVDRRWPYSFFYLTPEVICRSAVAAFPPCSAETVQA